VALNIDVKRFYLDNIASDCPKCGHECRNSYLSYPTANEPFDLDFYCGNCEEEHERRVLLEVRFTFVDERAVVG
jgi:hypothetical protein